MDRELKKRVEALEKLRRRVERMIEREHKRIIRERREDLRALRALYRESETTLFAEKLEEMEETMDVIASAIFLVKGKVILGRSYSIRKDGIYRYGARYAVDILSDEREFPELYLLGTVDDELLIQYGQCIKRGRKIARKLKGLARYTSLHERFAPLENLDLTTLGVDLGEDRIVDILIHYDELREKLLKRREKGKKAIREADEFIRRSLEKFSHILALLPSRREREKKEVIV